jgi:hypothetical protein
MLGARMVVPVRGLVATRLVDFWKGMEGSLHWQEYLKDDPFSGTARVPGEVSGQNQAGLVGWLGSLCLCETAGRVDSAGVGARMEPSASRRRSFRR